MSNTPSELTEATRERINAAVLDAFAAKEFHQVRLRDIATEAGVSLQTIYKYYGSKETLLYQSLDVWMSDLATQLTRHLRGIETYRDKLRKLFWSVLDFFERNPKVIQVFITSVHLSSWRHNASFRQTELVQLLFGVLREGREQGVLTDEVDEVTQLDFIYGVLSRIGAMSLLRGQTDDLTARSEPLFEMLWRAIAKPD